MLHKIFNWLIAKRLSKLRDNYKSSKMAVNIEEAKNVLLFIDCNSEEELQHAQSFFNTLKKYPFQTLQLMIVFNKKRPKDFNKLNNNQFILFKDDLNWLGIPSKASLSPFEEKSYDLLIDLSMKVSSSSEYVLSSIPSKMIVGWRVKGKEYLYDFMIQSKEKPTFVNYTQQVLFYLQNINKVKTK